MNRKAKGTRIERLLKKKLENDGYFVVRSAGSFGVADLIAIDRKKRPFIIQVKSGGRPNKKELKKSREVLLRHNLEDNYFLVIYKTNKWEVYDIYGRKIQESPV